MSFRELFIGAVSVIALCTLPLHADLGRWDLLRRMPRATKVGAKVMAAAMEVEAASRTAAANQRWRQIKRRRQEPCGPR